MKIKLNIIFFISSLLTLVGGLALPSRVAAAELQETGPAQKIIGMYIHQHWPYNHPYAARTWTVQDYRGYATGLKQLGFNTLMIWPILETMPDPLTPSDESNLE